MSRISNTPQLNAVYTRYLQDWMSAEEVMKRAELISKEVNYPAIQELRYAARRVIEAEIGSQNGLTDEELLWHLTEACENCRKAKHDSIDASVALIHVEIDELISRAGLDTVAQAFPQYVDLSAEMEAVGAKIVASRKNRQKLDREYDAIVEEHLKKIVEFYGKLRAAKSVVVAIEKRRRRDFWSAVVLGGLVVGVVASSIVLVLDRRGAFDGITHSPPGAAVGAGAPFGKAEK